MKRHLTCIIFLILVFKYQSIKSKSLDLIFLAFNEHTLLSSDYHPLLHNIFHLVNALDYFLYTF